MRPVRRSNSRSLNGTKYAVGTSVLKKFRAGWFEGKVVSYDDQSKFYRIKYEDGDEEEVEEKELRKILKLNIVGPENSPSQYSTVSTPSETSTCCDDATATSSCVPFASEKSMGALETNGSETNKVDNTSRVANQPRNDASIEDDIFNATPNPSVASETSKSDSSSFSSTSKASKSDKKSKEEREDDIFDATPSKELFGNNIATRRSKRNATLTSSNSTKSVGEQPRNQKRKRQAPKRFGNYENDQEESTPTSISSKPRSLLKTKASKKSSGKRTKRVRISSEGLKEKQTDKFCAEEDSSVWKPSELHELFSAHKSVDPKSFSFWEDVAELVSSKTGEECREKWFSLAQTPTAKAAPTKAKQVVSRGMSDIAFEDDIFNATPMRGVLDTSGCLGETKYKDESKAITQCRTGGIGTGVHQEYFPAGVQPKGYKMYIQKMGQCVRRRDPKPKKGRKNEAKVNKYLSEWDGEGDVEVNGRLSPGGTLRLKTHGDEEDVDFLNYYDNGEDIDGDMHS